MPVVESQRYVPPEAVVPLATPAEVVNGQVRLDVNSMITLVDFAIDGISSVDGGRVEFGFFNLSTTGGTEDLTQDQRYQNMETMAVILNRRAPLLVGVSAQTRDEVIDLTKRANEVGAAAVVVAPYMVDGRVADTVQAVIDHTDKPVGLYTNPAVHPGDRKGESLPVDEVRQALLKHPQVSFIKDSSSPTGNAAYQEQLRGLQNDGLSILVGNGDMLPALKAGVRGGASRLIGIFPVQAAELIRRRDEASKQSLTQMAQGVTIDSISGVNRTLFEMGLITSPDTFTGYAASLSTAARSTRSVRPART